MLYLKVLIYCHVIRAHSVLFLFRTDSNICSFYTDFGESVIQYLTIKRRWDHNVMEGFY